MKGINTSQISLGFWVAIGFGIAGMAWAIGRRVLSRAA